MAIGDGRIQEVSSPVCADAREEIDASGLHLFPGVIDVHVHFNDPGRAHWEGWATGSAAAAVGGTTTVAPVGTAAPGGCWSRISMVVPGVPFPATVTVPPGATESGCTVTLVGV